MKRIAVKSGTICIDGNEESWGWRYQGNAFLDGLPVDPNGFSLYTLPTRDEAVADARKVFGKAGLL